MKMKEFRECLDEKRITDAIAKAEQKTSGEIRVFVSSKKLPESEDVVARAAKRFEKLGMTRTRERNAVLLYFAPASKRFAVIGDEAIHRVCGQAFWDEVAGRMRDLLSRQAFSEAIVHGIAATGEVLARHFPVTPQNPNELPDDIEHD